MPNKIINWEKMSIEAKINFISNRKIVTVLSYYKIKSSEITQLINEIEKNENLKTKYQNEINNRY